MNCRRIPPIEMFEYVLTLSHKEASFLKRLSKMNITIPRAVEQQAGISAQLTAQFLHDLTEALSMVNE